MCHFAYFCRPSNRCRYDLFEEAFLGFLLDLDWKAVANESEPVSVTDSEPT